MNKKKILITGGAGFIGSHIVDRLIELGHSVVVVDNLITSYKNNVNPKSKFYQIDIKDVALEEIFIKETPEIVIHHAAQIDVQKSLENPMFDASCNIMGSINLLNCCVKYKVNKIIYASSAAVYGDPEYLPLDENHPISPSSNYGISKHTPEHYLRAYRSIFGLKYTILRYANVYGPRQSPKGEGGVISIFINNFLEGKSPRINGDGRQSRDFVFVNDIVSANVQAIEKGDDGIFNIGSGEQISIHKLFNELKRLQGSSLDPTYVDPRSGDILHSVFDISQAKDILGWSPEWELSDGLKKTVEYYTKLKRNLVASETL